jgi:hypothetical protein
VQHVSSELAFLAPGRHHCNWVGNGGEYKLVGNCLDCGMYVCMYYICMYYICMYVRMCVCMYIKYTLVGNCLDCGMYVSIKYGCMYVCMYVCMYACTV